MSYPVENLWDYQLSEHAWNAPERHEQQRDYPTYHVIPNVMGVGFAVVERSADGERTVERFPYEDDRAAQSYAARRNAREF